MCMEMSQFIPMWANLFFLSTDINLSTAMGDSVHDESSMCSA